jgi:hypothetical protein
MEFQTLKDPATGIYEPINPMAALHDSFYVE